MKIGRPFSKKREAVDFSPENFSRKDKADDNDLLQHFFEQSSLGICIIDDKGLIVEWNQAMSTMYETEREKYLHRPIWNFDYDYMPGSQKSQTEKKRIKEFNQKYLDDPEEKFLQDEYVHEINGQTKLIHYCIIPFHSTGKKYVGRISQDISDRKNVSLRPEDQKLYLEKIIAERTHDLQKSEARIRLLLQSIPMAYYSYDPTNRKEIWYSEHIEHLSGFSIDELTSQPDFWVSRIHPNDYERVKGTFDNLSPNRHVSCEYRWIQAGGTEIWINDQAVLIEASDKNPQQIIGCFMDITERKEAEYAIIESERNYREIFNSSSDAVIILNSTSGVVEDVNDTMLKMFKTTYSKALKRNFEQYAPGTDPFTATKAQHHFEKALTKGFHQFEWQVKRDDNSVFWADIILKPVILTGDLKIMAVVRNIDARKQIEEQINHQNDFEKLILDTSTHFINIPAQEVEKEIESTLKKICDFSRTDAGYLFLFDKEYKYARLQYLWQRKSMHIKKELFRELNTTDTSWHTEQIRAMDVIKVEDIDDLPVDTESLKHLFTNHGIRSFVDVPLIYMMKVIGYLGVALGKSGREWQSYEISLLKLSGQIFVNAIKRMESMHQLMESEEKYRLMVETQTDLIIKTDPAGNFLFVSPSYCELFDIPEEVLLSGRFKPEVHPADNQQSARLMENLFRPPYTYYYEQRIMTKKGWRWFAWNNKSILDEKNKVIEIIGVGRDITYQKGVEEALRRSEDRFRSIVQYSSDIILLIDNETSIIYDTPAIKKVLGYEEGFLVGKKWLELVHPDDMDVVRENLMNILTHENFMSPIEFRFKHADNRWIALEGIWKNMLKHSSIQGIVVTLRDISERKLVEKRIFDAVIKTEEQERERFAKNLHDDLGPLLSSLKMYINSLSTSSAQNKLEYIITQLNEVVKEAIQTTKEVSNDLSPHILMNYGLIAAIDNFLRKVPSTIEIRFANKLHSERYTISIENSFYRIVKELINNTLKHAEASLIEIRLEEHGNSLYLVYSDNGKGYDMKNNAPDLSSGMGISNIISRALSLNGNYEFQTSPGNGFMFKFNIPLNQSLE
jgi:PAS domain S-box-containing protein